MTGLFSNFFQRRKFRPVVRDLPKLLHKKYGGGEFYTKGQVETAARELRIRPGLLPAAFAVACEPEEFAKAEPDVLEVGYGIVREEVARVFDFHAELINCRYLLSIFYPKTDSTSPAGRSDGDY